MWCPGEAAGRAWVTRLDPWPVCLSNVLAAPERRLKCPGKVLGTPRYRPQRAGTVLVAGQVTGLSGVAARTQGTGGVRTGTCPALTGEPTEWTPARRRTLTGEPAEHLPKNRQRARGQRAERAPENRPGAHGRTAERPPKNKPSRHPRQTERVPENGPTDRLRTLAAPNRNNADPSRTRPAQAKPPPPRPTWLPEANFRRSKSDGGLKTCCKPCQGRGSAEAR